MVSVVTRPSVLIVEDDPDIRRAVAEILEDFGYDPLVARNGEEALTMLSAEKKPTAIILDLMMPVMDGWQFRRALQRDPELRGIPILILTGAGCNARVHPLPEVVVLNKPVNTAKLVDAVDRLCRVHRETPSDAGKIASPARARHN